MHGNFHCIHHKSWARHTGKIKTLASLNLSTRAWSHLDGWGVTYDEAPEGVYQIEATSYWPSKHVVTYQNWTRIRTMLAPSVRLWFSYCKSWHIHREGFVVDIISNTICKIVNMAWCARTGLEVDWFWHITVCLHSRDLLLFSLQMPWWQSVIYE